MKKGCANEDYQARNYSHLIIESHFALANSAASSSSSTVAVATSFLMVGPGFG